MKVCTITHDCPGFGTIPAGSLWADDSPYVTEANAANFDDVAPAEVAPAKPKTPPRKFGSKEPS